jgi:hypothetical protein
MEPEQGTKEIRPTRRGMRIDPMKLDEWLWNRLFIDELCESPKGAHDDRVDAASAAFRALGRRSAA